MIHNVKVAQSANPGLSLPTCNVVKNDAQAYIGSDIDNFESHVTNEPIRQKVLCGLQNITELKEMLQQLSLKNYRIKGSNCHISTRTDDKHWIDIRYKSHIIPIEVQMDTTGQLWFRYNSSNAAMNKAFMEAADMDKDGNWGIPMYIILSSLPYKVFDSILEAHVIFEHIQATIEREHDKVANTISTANDADIWSLTLFPYKKLSDLSEVAQRENAQKSKQRIIGYVRLAYCEFNSDFRGHECEWAGRCLTINPGLHSIIKRSNGCDGIYQFTLEDWSILRTWYHSVFDPSIKFYALVEQGEAAL